MTETVSVGRRSDARRNHELIMAAALEVFGEHGFDAGIPEVAARAGVGKATVYRNYPTKADLVSAVAMERLAWLEDRARRATEEPDAWPALREYIADLFEQLEGDLVLSQALRGEGSTEAMAVRQRIRRMIDHLIARGQQQGTVRPGVDANDLRILLWGLADQLHRDGTHDSLAWRRYANLAIDALAAR